MAPRDPKLRPYRAALWAVYFVVILVPIGLVIGSVFRHLRTPNRPAAATALPTRQTARVCLKEIEGLHVELNDRAWALGREVGAGSAVERFMKWSDDFELRVGDLGERCHLDGGAGGDYRGRRELARAREALLELHRAYRAQVNRFGQEGADRAREAAEAMAAARDAARQP